MIICCLNKRGFVQVDKAAFDDFIRAKFALYSKK